MTKQIRPQKKFSVRPATRFNGQGIYQEKYLDTLTNQTWVLTVWDISVDVKAVIGCFLTLPVLVDTDYRYSDWS
jgi:hypothetical protein